jgi:uncharacterized protein YjiS (DUF1127 family)
MGTIYEAGPLWPTATLTGRVSSFLRKCGDAFEERRQCRLLRARLSELSDRELLDIGTTRGEIDHVASNRAIDPRGARSAEWK